MALLEMQIEGVERVTTIFGELVAKVALLAVDIPQEAGRRFAGNVAEAVRQQSPVDTGALQAQTDQRNVGVGEFEIYSDAQNVYTGFQYAKARAYGFNVRGSGVFWVPPEDPPYPEAAAHDIQENILDGDWLDPSVMELYAILR